MSATAAKTPFQRLLDDAEAQFGQKQQVAQLIGITASRYTKVYKQRDYSLSISNCLRLALKMGRPPGEVLRAANHAAEADLLDAIYGQPTTALGTASIDQEFAATWRLLVAAERSAVLGAAKGMLEQREQVARAAEARSTPAATSARRSR